MKLKKTQRNARILTTVTVSLIALAGFSAINANAQNLWVANGNGFSVNEYSISGGTPLNTISGVPVISMATANNNLYISINGGTINVYSLTGVLLNTISSTSFYAGALATDNSGNLYVANNAGQNQNGDYVFVYNANNTLLEKINLNGAFASATMVVNSSGDLYVPTNNKNILEFSAGGLLLNTITNSSFENNPGIALNSSGDLYATTANNSIVEYDSNGNLIGTISNSALNNPVSLSIDNNGDLFVANQYGGNVLEFNSSGDLTNTISGSGMSQPFSILTVPAVAPTPEPGMAALCGLGALSLYFFRRRI